jgi:hypothetical protein
MVYIVQVTENGRVVHTERVASYEGARAIAADWKRRGFSVRITDDHNASYPPP